MRLKKENTGLVLIFEYLHQLSTCEFTVDWNKTFGDCCKTCSCLLEKLYELYTVHAHQFARVKKYKTKTKY